MANEMNTEYFDWMCNLVCDNRRSKVSYQKLLQHLNDVDFYYILPMDGNRFEDGEDLRYRFGYERNYHTAEVTTKLDIRPCSVLEMMIALCLRCEDGIMDNPDIGDRTGQWFWGMIDNLGLEQMTNDRFDEDYVDDILTRFMDREYDRNGRGGLFTVNNPRRDMRDVDIWYQMCWYLNEL